MTEYFYLALIPTANLPIYYSTCFTISYIDDNDLKSHQHAKEVAFRHFLGNPNNYNGQWSGGYNNFESANNARKSEIKALQNAGKTVLTPDWP